MKMKFMLFYISLSILATTSLISTMHAKVESNSHLDTQRKIPHIKINFKASNIINRINTFESNLNSLIKPTINRVLCSLNVVNDCYIKFEDIELNLKKKIKDLKNDPNSSSQIMSFVKGYYGKKFIINNRKSHSEVYGKLISYDYQSQNFEFSIENEKQHLKFDINDPQYSVGEKVLIGGKLLEIDNKIDSSLQNLLNKNPNCVSKNIRSDTLCEKLSKLNSIPCYPTSYEYSNFIGRSMKLKYNSYFINLSSYKKDPKNYNIFFNSIIIPKGVRIKITYVSIVEGQRIERFDPYYYYKMPSLNYVDNDIEIYIEITETETFKTIAELPNIYYYLNEIRSYYIIWYNADIRKTNCFNELKLIETELEQIKNTLKEKVSQLDKFSQIRFEILSDEKIEQMIRTNVDIVEYEKSIKQLKEALEKLISDYKLLESENVTFGKLIEANNKNIKCQNELLNKKNSEKDTLSGKVQQLSVEYEIITRNIHNLNWSIKSSDTNINNYKDQIDKLNKLIKSEEEKIKQWQIDLKKKNEEESECVQKTEHAKGLIKVLVKEIQDVDASIKEMQKSNKDMNENISKNNTKMQTITTQSQQVDAGIIEYQELKKKKVFEISDKARRRNMETQGKINENNRKIDETRSEIESLNSRNVFLNKIKMSKNTECEELEAKRVSKTLPLTRAISNYSHNIKEFSKMSGVTSVDTLLQLSDVYMNNNLENVNNQLLKDIGYIYNDVISINTKDARRRYKRIKRRLRRMRLI